jgi:hypothetical protein
MKNGMPLLPAAWKRCNFLITLKISSSETDMGESISAGYEALGILVRSAFGMGEKNWDFRASAFSKGVVAMPEGMTRLGKVGGVGERWLPSFAHFASCQIFHLLAASATACLKCAVLAFLMAAPLALSASKYALHVRNPLGYILCRLGIHSSVTSGPTRIALLIVECRILLRFVNSPLLPGECY